MERIILDADTGIDDALAIAYAVRSPELNVLGITTCFTNVSTEQATENAIHVLDHLDVDLPVIKGASQSIFGRRLTKYSTHIHGDDGLGNQFFGKPTKQPSHGNAAQFITEQVKKYPHEVTVVCLGSMTNLATAIMLEPGITPLIKRVVMMGGAIFAPGARTMVAAVNTYNDPEGAQLVFQSGVPITQVGRDVTLKTLLPLEAIDQWHAKNTRLSTFLANITKFYVQAYQQHNFKSSCSLHDPLAVGVVIDPTFVETEAMYLQVELEGNYSVGRTIADLREGQSHTPNVDVAMKVHVEKFVDHFLATVC